MTFVFITEGGVSRGSNIIKRTKLFLKMSDLTNIEPFSMTVRGSSKICPGINGKEG